MCSIILWVSTAILFRCSYIKFSLFPESQGTAFAYQPVIDQVLVQDGRTACAVDRNILQKSSVENVNKMVHIAKHNNQIAYAKFCPLLEFCRVAHVYNVASYSTVIH